MRVRVAIIAVSMLALLAPAASHGSDGFIAVADNYFDPPQWVAGAGDVVEWRTTCTYENECTGGHNVTAYEGASFGSPNPLGYPGSYSVTLDSDGPIGYRCTIHSTLSDGRCIGMCGLISKDADVTPPSATVAEPGPDELIIVPGASGPVPITGTANDNVAVAAVELTIYDVLGRPSTYPATCAGCPRATVSWERTLQLAPGVYTVEARAFDTAGGSRTSPKVRFLVV